MSLISSRLHPALWLVERWRDIVWNGCRTASFLSDHTPGDAGEGMWSTTVTCRAHFIDSNVVSCWNQVINWKSTLHIPPQARLSPEASDLIVNLCRGPEDRLGKNSTDEIKAHPFFKTIDFSSDLRQQVAPYIPTIAHSTDTSNFDPVDPEKLWSSKGKDNLNDTLNGWFRNGKHPEHAFYEFTFRRFFDDNGHPYSCPKPIEYEGYEDEADSETQDVAGSSAMQGRDLVYV